MEIEETIPVYKNFHEELVNDYKVNISDIPVYEEKEIEDDLALPKFNTNWDAKQLEEMHKFIRSIEIPEESVNDLPTWINNKHFINDNAADLEIRKDIILNVIQQEDDMISFPV